MADLTLGEMMMYGGAAAFLLLGIVLAIMLASFGRARKKLAEKIDKEMGE